MKPAALALIILTFLLPAMVRAEENPRFHSPVSYKEKQVVDFVKNRQKTNEIPYNLAPVDLNDDAIAEYIVRPQSEADCPYSPLCPYQIIAFQGASPVLIGEFDAHKMLLLDKKTYGIRQIIVYNVPYNDFKSQTAIWSPFAFRFELH